MTRLKKFSRTTSRPAAGSAQVSLLAFAREPCMPYAISRHAFSACIFFHTSLDQIDVVLRVCVISLSVRFIRTNASFSLLITNHDKDYFLLQLFATRRVHCSPPLFRANH